jgi:hypothetical protein
MAYDEGLATRVRDVIGPVREIAEKRMFGGLAFLLNGNMACGVHRDELIVRIAPDETDAALREPGVRLFDITGRPMKGWILVGEEGVAQDADLKAWVDRGVDFASTLPAK